MAEENCFSNRGSFGKVSVIIPTYNRTEFLKEAVESVLAQTYPVFEIFIIDDGSIPEYSEKLQLISGLSPLISLHRIPVHKGVSHSRNCGLRKAKGDYILFLDDDDLLHHKMIETGLSFFKANNKLDVVVCYYEIFFTPDSSDSILPLSFLFNYNELNEHPLKFIEGTRFVTADYLGKNPSNSFLRFLIPIHACLIRKKSMNDVCFPEDIVRGEDTCFWMFMATKGLHFKLYTKIYSYIRRHSKNRIKNKRNFYLESLKCYEKLIDSKILTNREDLFLVYLKLYHFKLKLKQIDFIKYFFMILKYPDLLIKEFFFYSKACLHARKKLIKYYYMD